MKEIREWLEKKGPYAAGVALYETHGKSQVVLKALRHGETEFTRATLRRELVKIAGEKPVCAVDTSAIYVRETANRVQVSLQKVPSSPAAKLEKVASSGQKVPSSPEKVPCSPEHPERRTWYATRAYDHAQLELVATDAERCQLAAYILALSEKITASFRAEVPAEVVPEVNLASLTDEGEIRRRLANLRPQASKLKKKPARAGDLARLQATITLLEAKLNRDGEPKLHPRH